MLCMLFCKGFVHVPCNSTVLLVYYVNGGVLVDAKDNGPEFWGPPTTCWHQTNTLLGPPHTFLLYSCHSAAAVPWPPQSQSCALESFPLLLSWKSHTINYHLHFLYLQFLLSWSLLFGNENCSRLFHTNERKERKREGGREGANKF